MYLSGNIEEEVKYRRLDFSKRSALEIYMWRSSLWHLKPQKWMRSPGDLRKIEMNKSPRTKPQGTSRVRGWELRWNQQRRLGRNSQEVPRKPGETVSDQLRQTLPISSENKNWELTTGFSKGDIILGLGNSNFVDRGGRSLLRVGSREKLEKWEIASKNNSFKMFYYKGKERNGN